jgi:hypothetical protein
MEAISLQTEAQLLKRTSLKLHVARNEIGNLRRAITSFLPVFCIIVHQVCPVLENELQFKIIPQWQVSTINLPFLAQI